MSKSIAITVGINDVPNEARDDERLLRAAVRAGIQLAVQHQLAPDLAAPHPRERRSFMSHLTDAEAAYLRGLMSAQGVKVPVAAAAGRLAEAGLRHLGALGTPAAPTSDALSQVRAALGMDERAEQRALYASARQALSGPPRMPIVMAQASTGVGKTAIAMALAVDLLRGAGLPVVVVAFPTVLGVKTFALQWAQARHGGLAAPPAHCVMAMREFASRAAVLALIEEHEDDGLRLTDDERETVEDWLAEQAEASERAPAVHTWLLDTLLDRVDRLDRESLAVNSLTDPADPGALAYRAQFAWHQRGDTPRLLVCTHAMLALDVLLRQYMLGRDQTLREQRDEAVQSYLGEQATTERRLRRLDGQPSQSLAEVLAEVSLARERAMLAEGEDLGSRRLPAYEHLIVDEAHLLEQSFSSIFSSVIALRETVRRLRQLCALDRRRVLRDAAEAAAAACDALTLNARDDAAYPVGAGAGAPAQLQMALRGVGLALAEVLRLKFTRPQALPIVAALRRDATALELALASGRRLLTHMDFSPVRRYPHIVVGEGNVSRPMHLLWAGVTSAVLLSATLYLRRSDGWSSRYQGSLLHVPSHRLAEIPVVESAWLFAPIQGLYLPTPPEGGVPGRAASGDRPWLMPPWSGLALPPAKVAAAREEWLQEVAEVVRAVCASAVGSVLIPCTSHEMVSGLARHLVAPHLGTHVLMRQPDFSSLAAMRQEAIRLIGQGQKVCLVATGGIWTGFDLSGSALGLSGEADNVLTDLVLPRLPFGMNRSMTHRQRVSNRRDPVPHEVLSVALTLQQAVGRLVRAPGLRRNRRIWLLDARMTDASLRGFLEPCKQVVRPYPLVPVVRADLDRLAAPSDGTQPARARKRAA